MSETLHRGATLGPATVHYEQRHSCHHIHPIAGCGCPQPARQSAELCGGCCRFRGEK